MAAGRSENDVHFPKCLLRTKSHGFDSHFFYSWVSKRTFRLGQRSYDATLVLGLILNKLVLYAQRRLTLID